MGGRQLSESIASSHAGGHVRGGGGPVHGWVDSLEEVNPYGLFVQKGHLGPSVAGRPPWQPPAHRGIDLGRLVQAYVVHNGVEVEGHVAANGFADA